MHFLSQPFGIILHWCQLFCTYSDDFKVGFHDQAPFKAVLEFPLGQMWDEKENEKKSSSSQICQAVCKGSVQAFSHFIFAGTSKGRTLMVFISQGSQVRVREERDPASTPVEGKWQGQCNAWLILALCSHLNSDHPDLTSKCKLPADKVYAVSSNCSQQPAHFPTCTH